MTISSATYKNQYTGNGSNTVFAYTFKIFSEDDIAVYEGDTLKTITTHYTVSGVGNSGGGNITFVTAPANGVIVTLKRAEPLTQDIEYTENDDFPSDAHEEGLDRSVIRDQTLQEQLDRCIKLSEGATASDITFPDLTSNAGYYLRVNSTEDGYEHFDIAGTGNLSVSAFAETLLDDASATEARTTLGVVIGTNVQAYNSGLANLSTVENTGTAGLLTLTSANTNAVRTLTGTTDQITITNGNGASGNPTVSLSSTITGNWASWTPTIAAGSGTFTTVSGSGTYLKIGKTVWYRVSITITDAGTAAGFCSFTLPTGTAAGVFIGTGMGTNVSGQMCKALVSGTTGQITEYDNTTPIATGEVLVASGFYVTT